MSDEVEWSLESGQTGVEVESSPGSGGFYLGGRPQVVMVKVWRQ